MLYLISQTFFVSITFAGIFNADESWIRKYLW